MSKQKKKYITYFTRSYSYLAEELAEAAPAEIVLGPMQRKPFDDNELYDRFLLDEKNGNPDGQHVLIIGGWVDDQSFMENFDLAYNAIKYGARTLTVLVPWMYYSTMERDKLDGEFVKAKTRAFLFSQLPQASHGNRFVFFDLHTEGLPFYMENGVRSIHLYGKKRVFDTIQEIVEEKGVDNVVLGATDEGRSKWVRSLADDKYLLNLLGIEKLPHAYVIKKRSDKTNKTKAVGIWGDVLGKHVLLFDDMGRTMGSAIEAAKMYLRNGALSVVVILTHAVLPGDSLAKFQQEVFEGKKIAEKVYVTNSHSRGFELASSGKFKGFLELRSIKDIVLEFLRTGRRQ